MADHGETITRDLTVRYITVLVVLGGLAIVSFLGLTRIMTDAESGTILLNVAGRQRMLVERAALAASRLGALAPVFSTDRERARRLLADSLDVLESSHIGLLDGLPEIKGGLELSERARAIYFGPDGGVDAKIRAFVADGRALLASDQAIGINDPRVVAMVAAADGPLLAGLDEVAALYQAEGRERLVHLSVMHGAALAATLLLLIGSAAFVFGPMTRRIRGDIEERTQAERDLRESGVRLRRILEESPVGVSVSRRDDGVVVFANARFCEILGATVAEVIGSRARDHYVDDAQRDRLIRILKDKGRIDDFEVEFRRRDGTPFSSLLTLRCTQFEGEAVNLAWVYDISALKDTREQLKLAGKVLETASEAVVITNARNEIEFVNPAFTTITEYTAAEAIGRNPGMLQSGRHDADFYRAMWRSLQETGRWRGEIWNRRKSGEFYAEWLSIVGIKDETGATTHHVAVFSDITHRKEDEERVWRQANYDALTGLPNRALFVDRLSQAVRHSRRNGARFALMFIDLDGFKQVNDTLGHAAGDVLLQQTAARLTECMRASDTVARLAGDEFTIILQGIAGREDAGLVAAKILDALARPFHLDNGTAQVRGSIGIAIFPEDADDGSALLNMADEAMYAVKRQGKNNFVFVGEPA